MKIDKIEPTKKAIIIGASSDIGAALYSDWEKKKWDVVGTYRTLSDSIHNIKKKNANLFECDLSDVKSIEQASSALNKSMSHWDVLVFAPGLQEPVELFSDCDFEKWESSIQVNFTSQLRLLHRLLKNRNKKKESYPSVLFFAGGGVNNAPINYSAYTISKIALIKMVELLAAEIEDVKFLIIGPGWVNTKIHQSVLEAGERAGHSYSLTKQKFKDNDFVPMSKVVRCCNKLILAPKEIFTGRNYSVANDQWDKSDFQKLLKNNPDMYKLRRYLNDI